MPVVRWDYDDVWRAELLLKMFCVLQRDNVENLTAWSTPHSKQGLWREMQGKARLHSNSTAPNSTTQQKEGIISLPVIIIFWEGGIPFPESDLSCTDQEDKVVASTSHHGRA